MQEGEREEKFVLFENGKLTEVQLKELIGCYQRALNTTEGMKILADLRSYARMDESWGCALSHEEFAYRAGLQDMFKYIEALSTEGRQHGRA